MTVVVQNLHPGSSGVKAVSVVVTLRGTVQIVIVAGTRIGSKVGIAVIAETVITVGRAIQKGMLRGEAVIGGTGTRIEMDVRVPTEAGAGAGVRAVAEPTATAIALAHLVKHQSHPTWQS
jgi:NDP-sugar pyrophosphorylase family protein